jgi:membrane-associated phospholipid phosphatase
MNSLKSSAWFLELKSKRFRIELAASIAVFALVTWLFSLFLTWNEAREGSVFDDPLLALFTPLDISPFIFTATYLPVIVGIIILARHPRLVLALAQGYTLLMLFRMITIYLVPLEPPRDIIPLHDPVLEHTAYSGKRILKDLFFSGHTATLFLFSLLMPNRKWKLVFLLLTIILAIMIVLQHVHYTIDVLAAPLFAWLVFRLVRKKLVLNK